MINNNKYLLIRISRDLGEKLKVRMGVGDTYDSVIQSILEQIGKEKEK